MIRRLVQLVSATLSMPQVQASVAMAAIGAATTLLTKLVETRHDELDWLDKQIDARREWLNQIIQAEAAQTPDATGVDVEKQFPPAEVVPEPEPV
jgi:hypothetical protein